MKHINLTVHETNAGAMRAVVCYQGNCTPVESEVLHKDATPETRQYAVENFMRNLSKVIENRIFRK